MMSVRGRPPLFHVPQSLARLLRAAGLPPSFPIEGDMCEKEVFGRFLASQLKSRGLLTKEGGFFNRKFESCEDIFKPPHCIFVHEPGAAGNSEGTDMSVPRWAKYAC
eukprot:8819217-Pyramimonas_sp.AAC.1